ncbi:N-methylhydantoinase A [Dethiosulfatibacter aminovorans DSM 17477]|uniref:N-methylhydantoinase A n=1 Tax=Dethiosulfatibacter aminovorans DSM 17477 TaxID=1121476 RepID=A0A1M6GKS1_9FIRM|nr:hydantoinase/oxoprolinase family protein [Dethiosulfatibacter aminovorans]SHJ10528.1 N-methylhydantoinase A [Dethiosulfatibacter aminovorans DSM 17477]
MSYMIGVDVGGTFTDFSVFNNKTGELFNYKDSSTPEDPSKAIVKGIEDVLEIKGAEADEVVYLAHGTTVGTNALIEKKGSRLALITTKGFKDLMEIGTQRRPSLYNLQAQKPFPLIPSGLNCEVTERILYDGSVETPLDEQEVREVVNGLKNKGVKAIAVCTLFSFINPVHEERIEEIIKEEFPEAYVTISSKLAPEFREFSRMSTTVLNSYLGPVMEKYVNNFQNSIRNLGIKVEPYVTQSNGSIISIKETIECPIKTAVSGPSAGVIAAAHVGKQCEADKIITFDMGGTSADISLIENYVPQISNERDVEGYPARIPMINIITIGAGGGSIAQIDEGGALKVGPESAGATPGPACYGRGGTVPVVTDANIVVGKLNQEKILGGRMKVHLDKANKALDENICAKSSLSRDEAANGIITVVNSNMIRAIRSVSVEKGYDVREFSLMAFGGAGPLHACEVAEDLGIGEVIIPPSPGTLCSLGLLLADTKFDLSRTNILIGEEGNIDEFNKLFDNMVEQGTELLDKENVPEERRSFEFSIDIRYNRQNFELNIPIPAGKIDCDVMKQAIADFHTEHKRSYGYCNENAVVQFVSYRVSAIGRIDKPDMAPEEIHANPELPESIEIRNVLFQGETEFMVTPVYNRTDFVPGNVIPGPCIVEQMDTTIVVPKDWKIHVDGYLNLKIQYSSSEH